jgi:hypothetical protein
MGIASHFSLRTNDLHRKKSFSIFKSPAGKSFTKLSLGGNNDVIYKLFPPRESLVSDILAGDGNIKKLFYDVSNNSNSEIFLKKSLNDLEQLNCAI